MRKKDSSHKFKMGGAPRPGRGEQPAVPDEDGSAKKESLFGKFGSAFQDKLQNNRGPERAEGEVVVKAPAPPETTIGRVDNVNGQRMIVPEGVVIQGSLTSASETEIAGRIDGDVTVEGQLELAPTGVVTGNVKAGHCRIEGTVEGQTECSRHLELSEGGLIKADVITGETFLLAGEVHGNISCAGKLHLQPTAKVHGAVRARTLLIEEGAVFNGECVMRPLESPAQGREQGKEQATEKGQEKKSSQRSKV